MAYRVFARALMIAALLAPARLWGQGAAAPAGAMEAFETLPNGGIIEIQRASDDSAAMRAVRIRLRTLAQALSQGDVSSPEYARMTSAPGGRVMLDRRNAIRYDYRDLPRGGALRISTSDYTAQKAIWEFIAFQRNENMAGP
jgi:hypothetical protein